tara:strand:- start:411 stop:650 length:240 start_codon:yes stop_codon:yes gene_type:complete
MKLTKTKLKQIIKEELNEYSGYGDDLTPEQQKVVSKFQELTEAVYEMGESDPAMTDYYIMLLRALEQSGVRIQALAHMV